VAVVSFRYHLVSLAAALLALAAGVVLGAGPLADDVDAALSPSPSASADTSVEDLQARVAFDDAYAAATEPRLLAGQLTDRRVVVVVLPATPTEVVSAGTAALTTAGAEVSGQVRITDAWVDPGQASVLSGIAERLAPPGAEPPAGASPYEVAAADLAAALVTDDADQVGVRSDPATALLTGLAEGGFLTTTGEPDALAGLAVVLSPAVPADGTVPALLPIAPALDAAAGAVLAGPSGSAADGGLVAVHRAEETLRATASTVDVVDLAAGRVALVLALAERAEGGRGAYGAGPGADAPVPAAS
jgi:hypothetical protein